MPEIIVAGHSVLFDEQDADIVLAHRWHIHPVGEKLYARGYLGRRKYAKLVYMHRLILAAQAGFDTDHIDGSGLDNRRANLRQASRTINNLNRQSRGVFRCATTQRWRARIEVNGQKINLGRFDTESEAHAAYLAEKAKHLPSGIGLVPHFELRI